MKVSHLSQCIKDISSFQSSVDDSSILGMINHINDYPEDMTGRKVVVVGGGAVGLDVVEFFAARNAEISIVEMMDQIGRDLDPVTKNDMKDQMKKHHVAQLTKTALQESSAKSCP